MLTKDSKHFCACQVVLKIFFVRIRKKSAGDGKNQIISKLLKKQGCLAKAKQPCFCRFVPDRCFWIIAIWFCVASNFVGKRPNAADFPSRFRTTQNQIAICQLKCRPHNLNKKSAPLIQGRADFFMVFNKAVVGFSSNLSTWEALVSTYEALAV